MSPLLYNIGEEDMLKRVGLNLALLFDTQCIIIHVFK